MSKIIVILGRNTSKYVGILVIVLLICVLMSCEKETNTYVGNSENWKVRVSLSENSHIPGTIKIEYTGADRELNYFEYSLRGLLTSVAGKKEGNIHMPLKFSDSINNPIETDNNTLNITIIWGSPPRKSENITLEKK